MKIETNPKVLQRQQLVLAQLGYYDGKIDGVWAPSTIDAKRKFERSGQFNPGIPNQGLPFVVGNPLPKGVFADPFAKGLISCKGLTEEVIADLLQTRGVHTGKAIVTDTAKVEAPAKVVEPEPVIESPVVIETTENKKEAPVATETPKKQESNNQHQQKKPKHSNQNSRHRQG